MRVLINGMIFLKNYPQDMSRKQCLSTPNIRTYSQNVDNLWITSENTTYSV